LEFDAAAFEDVAWWVEHDRAVALRIMRLVRIFNGSHSAALENPSH
jgi:Txe/YoeB family toxin of Txe-Axe toxin-antitoxin module